MTQEEKAKAYDEAIKKAESLYKASEPMSGCNVIIETLFPELKESEDEKIRKWIINEIKIKHHNLDEDNVDFVDKAIAWLENIPYTIDHEKREGFHLGYKAGLEKQGRQKPADEVETITQSYITPNLEFFQWIYDRLIYVHHENPDVDYMHSLKERIEDMQKPAWSEEDDYNLQCMIAKAVKDIQNGEVGRNQELIDWLKSLKQRIGG